MNPTKYAVEFKTGTGWKRWNRWLSSRAQARLAIEARNEWADHIERRVVEVES